jgi:hypothetical protein
MKTYKATEVSLSGSKAFQLTATSGRVYVIDEDGAIEVAYQSGDKLGQVVTNKKAKAKDDSLDEDEMNQDENAYLKKLARIEDIHEEIKENSDANNASIIAGSDAEDDEEEVIEENTKDKSYLKNLLSIQDKPSM